MNANIVRLFVMVALVFSSACGQAGVQSSPASPSGIVLVTATVPTGTLSVTPSVGTIGTQPVIGWSTTATNAVVQVCEVQGAGCVGYREVIRGGSAGQVQDTPLPAGNWRYRLLGYENTSFVFAVTTQDVVIN